MASLKVMTWNILHETSCAEEEEHPWRRRAPAARSVVERVLPEVLCTQEAYPKQMSDLLENLPHYWWQGLDRNGRLDGEGCLIAYDTTRVKPLEWGSFWLGVDPDVPGSLTWVNDVPRMLTWGRFEHLATGARFFVANTHLDHLVPPTRTKEIALIKKRIPRGSISEPVILCGDFNCPAWSKPHRALTSGPDRFHDTYYKAEDGERLLSGTFHNFKGSGFARFDWILTRPRVTVKRLRILRDAPDGVYPSDHYPVVAELVLPAMEREPPRPLLATGAHGPQGAAPRMPGAEAERI